MGNSHRCAMTSAQCVGTVVDPGGAKGAMVPQPVEISQKKDGHQRWPHRFHVSWPPTQPLDPMLLNLTEKP